MEDAFVAEIDLEYEPGSCAGPVALRRVPGIERTAGTRVDPAYVRHLDVCNGGNPNKRCFPVPGNVKVIERFLCLIEDYRDNDEHGDYDVGVVFAQIEGRFDGHQFPFAALFGGDFLVFDDRGGAVPHVAVWDHERSRADSPALTPVADDFAAFLSLLYEDDNEDDEDEE